MEYQIIHYSLRRCEDQQQFATLLEKLVLKLGQREIVDTLELLVFFIALFYIIIHRYLMQLSVRKSCSNVAFSNQNKRRCDDKLDKQVHQCTQVFQEDRLSVPLKKFRCLFSMDRYYCLQCFQDPHVHITVPYYSYSQVLEYQANIQHLVLHLELVMQS